MLNPTKHEYESYVDGDRKCVIHQKLYIIEYGCIQDMVNQSENDKRELKEYGRNNKVV